MALPEMEGTLFVVRGNNLIGVKWTSLADLGKKMDWLEANGFESYFAAKANKNADVVIGAVSQAMASPAVQLQSTEPPDCPIHHKPLKASQYGGYYCPRKIGNNFCPVKIDTNGIWQGIPK